MRRHALGVIRMLIEQELPFNLDELIAQSTQLMNLPEPNHQPDGLLEFVYERLSGILREQGYSAQEVDAVLSLRPQRLSDIPDRLAAVRSFSTLPEAESLAAANKRVGNILKKADGKVAANVDKTLLAEPAEAALYQAVDCSKTESGRRF